MRRIDPTLHWPIFRRDSPALGLLGLHSYKRQWQLPLTLMKGVDQMLPLAEESIFYGDLLGDHVDEDLHAAIALGFNVVIGFQIIVEREVG